MIVIADSSPLHYLILIDAAQTLPELFGEVLVPEAVFRELRSAGAPPKIAAFLARPRSGFALKRLLNRR